MKKTILFLALVAIFFNSSIAQTTPPTGPAISLNKDVHDYGDVAYGASGEGEFIVTNTGTEPLIISQCQGSCGCTVPKCDPNPIDPGKTSIITVKYDTKRPGPISKTVTINSNAVNEPTKVVSIKGTVGPDPATAPSGAPVKTPAGAPGNP